MSLLETVEPGALFKPLKEKKALPPRVSSTRDAWDYPDDGGGLDTNQDAPGFPSRDDTDEDWQKRQSQAQASKGAITADKGYKDWKTAQQTAITGRAGSGKKEKAGSK